MRQRADHLAPLVADFAYAAADWHAADTHLVGAQTRLAAARRGFAEQSPETHEQEITVLGHEVRHAHELIQSAYESVASARAALIEAAGDEPVVTHDDATHVWRTAADLDLLGLNDLRRVVAAHRDAVWRAENRLGPVAGVNQQVGQNAQSLPGSALDYGRLACANDVDVPATADVDMDYDPHF